MSSWLTKALNTAADFTPVGWASRAINGKGAASNVSSLVSGAGGALTGQNSTAQPYETIPFAGDADNQLAQQQAASIARWQQYQDDLSGKNGQIRQAWAQQSPPPPPITDEQVRAEQMKQDRARLLSQAAGYGNLVGALKTDAFGNPDTGPSAAMSTLQAATDRNIKTGFGMAAGAEGTGGQRASLMQAALGNAAEANQAAANQAATLRAQEHQAAVQNQLQNRSLLGQAIGAQTDVYGNLLSSDQSRETSNLQAATQRDQTEAERAQQNANNKTAFWQNAMKTVASGLSHA